MKPIKVWITQATVPEIERLATPVLLLDRSRQWTVSVNSMDWFLSDTTHKRAHGSFPLTTQAGTVLVVITDDVQEGFMEIS